MIEAKDTKESAKAVIYNKEGQILILQRASHMRKNPDKWDIPGGHIKEGETPVAGLRREVEEETGLQIKDIIELGQAKHSTVFQCSVFGDSEKVILDEENQNYRWVKPGDVPDNFVPRFIPYVKYWKDYTASSEEKQ